VLLQLWATALWSALLLLLLPPAQAYYLEVLLPLLLLSRPRP
jgi:hypothetical protein